MMAQHYKIYFVLLIVIILSSNTCYAQLILDGDTAFFDDGDIFGAGAGTDILGGTGTDFSALSALLPLLLLAPLLFAATTSTAAQAVQAPVAAAPVAAAAAAVAPVTPQTITVLVPAATTPCVSETCPAGFMVLPNQASSTSCYSDSGSAAANDRSWNDALLACASTPGAYLWRPNTEQEAADVRNKYNFPNADVWTGANDIALEGTYIFAIENSQLNLAALPFGNSGIFTGAPNDCVGIQFNGANWVWSDALCTTARRFICELPRRVCP